jgi:hypothetical protein
MKRGLILVLGIMILVIVVAGLWILVSPGNREGITGAMAGVVTVAGEKCPAGDDFKTVSQCKVWKSSGIKAKEFQILTDDSLNKFCNKVLELYPEC